MRAAIFRSTLLCGGSFRRRNMATELSEQEISSSTSDESDINDVLGIQDGLQGYLFEPRRKAEDCLSSEESTVESASDSDMGEVGVKPPSRLENVEAWCSCGHCSTATLSREKECVCCQEKATTRKLAANKDADRCITNSGEFETLCRVPVVLRNVLVGLNNVRGDRWNVNPADNKGYRFAAYRQFTWWVHGKLGPGRRRVIPACAIHSIRETFPNAGQDVYKGYITGEESSDDDL